MVTVWPLLVTFSLPCPISHACATSKLHAESVIRINCAASFRVWLRTNSINFVTPSPCTATFGDTVVAAAKCRDHLWETVRPYKGVNAWACNDPWGSPATIGQGPKTLVQIRIHSALNSPTPPAARRRLTDGDRCSIFD